MDAQTKTPTLVVDPRFAGPPGSGNGGYTAGRLAASMPTAARGGVQVTLRTPPPLGVELGVELVAGPTTQPADGSLAGARLLHEDTLVADARLVEVDITPVDAVTLADACEAEREYAGLRAHPFPTCFTCGPDRAPGDGLRLAPGPVRDRRTACTWTADPALDDATGLVRDEFVWAALDCPGGWTADLQGRPMVLGRITAQLDDRARIGERHVVMGQWLGEEGRKTFTATTIYDSDGRVVARAQHLWIAVDPATFGAEFGR